MCIRDRHCTACNLTLLQCRQYWVSFDNSCDWMWILNIFELFRTLLHLELFLTFLSFKLISSNFTTMKKSAASAFEMFIYIYLSKLSSQPVYTALCSLQIEILPFTSTLIFNKIYPVYFISVSYGHSPFNFCSNLWWGTVSNAFYISNK